jgi:hypothetical protein
MSSEYRLCIFIPTAERMTRRDWAVRPCLPMTLPMSSLCTVMAKHMPSSCGVGTIRTASAWSTRALTICASRPHANESLGPRACAIVPDGGPVYRCRRCSLETVCPYPQNHAQANSAQRRRNCSATTETGHNGELTPVRFVEGWLALSKSEDNGCQSGIGRQWRIRRARCWDAGSGRRVVATSRRRYSVCLWNLTTVVPL